MSHFLFGCLIDSGSRLAEESVAKQVQRLAVERGFYAALENGIPQPCVHKMISQFLRQVGVEASRCHTRFMLTKRPADDTSDSLIGVFTIDDKVLAANVSMIGCWVRSLFDCGLVNHMYVLIVEGEDIEFLQRRILAEDFEAEMHALLTENGGHYWPSAALLVNRD